MQRLLIATATLLSLAVGPVHAGRVAVEVVDVEGRPVRDAVVSLEPAGGAAPKAYAPTTHYVDQKNETFIPYVTALHAGDSVVFRNSDGTRHQVYSFSGLAKFEYVLSPGESSPPLVLPRAGNVAVGCNIHDMMIAYLYVTKDADLAVTDAKGRATLDGVGAGSYRAHAWHPQLRPGIVLPVQGVSVDESTPGKVTFTLALLPDPRGTADREHIGY